MTVIAAVTDGRHVWMAADSAGECNGLIITVPKLRRTTHFLFGCAGDRSAGVALQRVVADTPPDPASDDDVDAWVQAIAEAWTAHVDDLPLGPWRPGSADHPPLVDGTALLAHAGRLYRLTTNLAVRLEQHYAAVGAGAEIAYGAFHAALALDPTIAPELLLEVAVGAATTWHSGCHPPMRTARLPYPGDDDA